DPLRMFYLAPKIGRVLLREVRPFLWKVVERENCGYWADGDARPAIDAFNRIDINQLFTAKFRVVLLGMNAIHRARVYACCIFGPDAGFCYYVSHIEETPLDTTA